MADETHAHPSVGRAEASHDDDVGVLMTRLVDGEASDEDRREFTEKAERSPELWRALAERQREMGLIRQAAEREVQRAEHVGLPDAPSHHATPGALQDGLRTDDDWTA